MLKRFHVLLSLISLAILIQPAPSIAKEFTEGKDYTALSTPQPTETPNKIEVLEFFWYGCPHCYSFEPHLQKWLANKPEDVAFIREPATFNKTWAAHAKAYFTAEVLGISDKMHAAFFDAIQNKHQSLKSEDDLVAFFGTFGVEKEKFLTAYNSFLVHTKMKKAETMGPTYGITGVPTVIVNGKYAITGRLAKSYENMIEILDYLVDKERQAQ